MRAVLSAIGLMTALGGVAARADDVTQGATFHADPARSGNYVVPGLTWAAASTMQRLAGFDGRTTGNVNAQPLYWRAPGAANGIIVIATDQNVVQAIDSVSGRSLWQTSLGPADPRPVPRCGAPRQQGIYGTPVIDPARGVVYAIGSVRGTSGSNEYGMWAVSLTDGSIVSGWPLMLAKAVIEEGEHFVTIVHDQRTALTLAGGWVYAGFAANHGDCGAYHGWLMAVDTATAQVAGLWHARSFRAGIWSTGGVSSDGSSLFATTGNGIQPDGWVDGETVFRFSPSLSRPTSRQDYFVPTDYRSLDNADYDLGGSSPLPIDVPLPGGGTAQWLLQIGKGGVAYVLDRTNLGGIGGELAATNVAQPPVVVKGAAFPTALGVTEVFPATGIGCPGGTSVGAGLVAISVSATPAPRLSTQWCAAEGSFGVPSVTTIDGQSDPIVWITTAAASTFLMGYRGDTGQTLYTSGPAADCLASIPSHASILAVEGKFFIGAQGRVCAFGFTPAP